MNDNRKVGVNPTKGLHVGRLQTLFYHLQKHCY